LTFGTGTEGEDRPRLRAGAVFINIQARQPALRVRRVRVATAGDLLPEVPLERGDAVEMILRPADDNCLAAVAGECIDAGAVFGAGEPVWVSLMVRVGLGGHVAKGLIGCPLVIVAEARRARTAAR
jgi:hypothetical protein